jgi:hypothetical protein
MTRCWRARRWRRKVSTHAVLASHLEHCSGASEGILVPGSNLFGDTLLYQRPALKDLLDALTVDLEQSRQLMLDLFDVDTGNNLAPILQPIGGFHYESPADSLLLQRQLVIAVVRR